MVYSATAPLMSPSTHTRTELSALRTSQAAPADAPSTARIAAALTTFPLMAIKAFFDEVLGEDAYPQLVQKPSSMEQNNDAIFDFVEAYTKAMQDVNAKTQKRLESFTKFTAPKRRRT